MVDTICDIWYIECVPQNVTKGGIILEPNIIGERLVELRGNRTQEEVAKSIGISSSALSMYETGERIPRDPIKIELAKYYKRSVQSIFFSSKMPRKVTNEEGGE